MLKDKIALKIRPNQVKEKLLTEDELHFKIAIIICKTSKQSFQTIGRVVWKLLCKHKRNDCPAFNKPCNKGNKNDYFDNMCYPLRRNMRLNRKISLN